MGLDERVSGRHTAHLIEYDPAQVSKLVDIGFVRAIWIGDLWEELERKERSTLRRRDSRNMRSRPRPREV